MKKKFISMALSAVMAFSLAAASVSAASASIWKAPKLLIRLTGGEWEEIDGKSGYHYTPTGEDTMWLQFEYTAANVAENPYIWVDYYYSIPGGVTENTSLAKNMVFQLHQLGGSWEYPNSVKNARDVVSTDLTVNQWSRAVFDASELANAIKTDAPGKNITQYALQPFGTELTSNYFQGQSVYISGIWYSDQMPSLYIPMVHYDEEGKAYAYVSENGSVTIDGETIGAFQSVKSAFEALGDQEGATVYLSGTVSSFEDVSTRKNVLLRGLGDSEEEIAANVLNGFYKVTGGDITVDYLTLQGAPKTSEPSLYSTGSTITIGKNVEVAGGGGTIFAGLGNEETSLTKKRTMIFNGGTWQSVAAGTNYSGNPNGEVGGAVDYTFNDGLFYGVWGGSKESWEWANTKVQGDVNFTFNGGSYSGSFYLGSQQHPCEVLGNITWNVNGGVWNYQNIIGGHSELRTASGITTGTPLRNVAVLVNNQNLTADSALNTLTLGREGDGINIGGKEIYIINHYEKNTGTKINPASTAAYRIHVTNGSAEPVYKSDVEYGGDLLGFRLTAEDETADLYINGVKTEKTADGIYTITENKTAGEITEIAFIKGDEGVRSVSESDGDVKEKVYSFELE